MLTAKQQKALDEHAWGTPDSYMGHNPVGAYVVATRNRDSQLLDESNWDATRAALMRAGAEILQDDEGDVYDFRAHHWACGWVEYLIVRPEAPEPVKAAAADCIIARDAYPILDEDDYSKRQCEAQFDYWRGMLLQDRVELCRENGDSIFAARRSNDIPEGVSQYFSDCELFF